MRGLSPGNGLLAHAKSARAQNAIGMRTRVEADRVHGIAQSGINVRLAFTILIPHLHQLPEGKLLGL
jgi:hypothetical protein